MRNSCWSGRPARRSLTWKSSPWRRREPTLVNRLIVANLVIRPVRTLLSVTAVAVEVVLIIMVVGLTDGILEEVARRTQGVGAEIMVQPQTTSMFLGLSGAPMPVQLAERLAQVPQVKAVAPVIVQVSSTGGVTLIYG